MSAKNSNPDLDVTLTVLSTSDVHGALGAYNTLTGALRGQGGLTRLYSEVQQIRATHDNVLLLDNGDFLQGDPLCELAQRDDLGLRSANPVIAAMNLMQYDACGLGNHEFDFGLSNLKFAVDQADFPILCSNADAPLKSWQSTCLLQRYLRAGNGQSIPVKIGILALTPPQVLLWNRYLLDSQLIVSDYAETAASEVNALRNQGADLVIALCHAGLETVTMRSCDLSAAHEVAAVAGVDLVIAGHTHEVDVRQSRRSGPAPALMTGYNASHLGKTTITLKRSSQRWDVRETQCEVIAIEQTIPEEHTLAKSLAPAIQKGQTSLNEVIGKSDTAIQNFFAPLSPDLPSRLTATALSDFGEHALADTPYAGLPIVVALAPVRCGGRGGPDHFCVIKAGEVTLRDLYQIQPFTDALDGFCLTGSQLVDWTTAASERLCTVEDNQDVPVLRADKAIYDFDTLYGLTYDIDLSQPAQGDKLVGGQVSARVKHLSWDHQPIKDQQKFILLTTSYRGGGSGSFPHAIADNRIDLPVVSVRDILRTKVAQNVCEDRLLPTPWRLTARSGSRVFWDTSPMARGFEPNLTGGRLSENGLTEDGFLRYTLTFS